MIKTKNLHFFTSLSTKNILTLSVMTIAAVSAMAMIAVVPQQSVYGRPAVNPPPPGQEQCDSNPNCLEHQDTTSECARANAESLIGGPELNHYQPGDQTVYAEGVRSCGQAFGGPN